MSFRWNDGSIHEDLCDILSKGFCDCEFGRLRSAIKILEEERDSLMEELAYLRKRI